MLIKYLMLLLM